MTTAYFVFISFFDCYELEVESAEGGRRRRDFTMPKETNAQIATRTLAQWLLMVADYGT
jgi:hypothetical protein